MNPQEAATQLVDAISECQGVPSADIGSITLKPTSIEIVFYERDANGQKFISGDTVATAHRKIPYRYPA